MYYCCDICGVSLFGLNIQNQSLETQYFRFWYLKNLHFLPIPFSRYSGSKCEKYALRPNGRLILLLLICRIYKFKVFLKYAKPQLIYIFALFSWFHFQPVSKLFNHLMQLFFSRWVFFRTILSSSRTLRLFYIYRSALFLL